MAKSKSKAKGTVYIPVGIPGSGKSTWFDRQGFDAADTAFISMDDIRQEIASDVADQSKNALVAKIAKDRFKQALSIGVPVIFWDATSVKRKYRKELIKPAKQAGYEVVAVYFDVPLEVAKQRNADRERNVPEHVLDRMWNQMQKPERDEGFDVIQTVRA
jgi:predicted kinase